MNRSDHAVLFDFFGVICSEVAPFWLERYFPEEDAARIKAELVAPADRGDVSEEEMFAMLGERTGVPADQALEDWLALAVRNPAFPALLERLRQHATVALLSNAPGAFLHRLLDRENLYPFFDRIMISSEERLVKPDPAIYSRLVEQLGIDPARCVMIDDNPANLRGAEQAGIPGILFRDAESLEEALALWESALQDADKT